MTRYNLTQDLEHIHKVLTTNIVMARDLQKREHALLCLRDSIARVLYEGYVLPDKVLFEYEEVNRILKEQGLVD